MIQQDTSDSELIRRLRNAVDAEKSEIILALYERYKNLVLKISYQQLGDYDRGSDVLHDVFIRVIDHVQNIRDGAVVKSWIITITRNRCVDLLRKASYLKNAESLDPRIEISVGERTEDVMIASIDKEKMMRSLSDCIAFLGNLDLNVFKLRWKGFKSAQLSKSLSLDKMQLRRSYDRIKNVLQGCMHNKGLDVSIDQILCLAELDE